MTILETVNDQPEAATMSKPRNERKSSCTSPSKTPPSVREEQSPTVRSTRATPRRKLRHTIDGDARRSMIAEAAYYRAERRNFADGSDFDDWIEAESQVDKLLDLDSER